MPSDDSNLLAAIADAEILRHQLALTEQLLAAERRRIDDLDRQVDSLDRRAMAAEERQRELQVLLLHRDEEIARLHGYLQSAWKPGQPEAAEKPVLLPEPDPAPSPRAVSTEERVVAQLASDVAAAGRWLGRIVNRARRDGREQ